MSLGLLNHYQSPSPPPLKQNTCIYYTVEISIFILALVFTREPGLYKHILSNHAPGSASVFSKQSTVISAVYFWGYIVIAASSTARLQVKLSNKKASMRSTNCWFCWQIEWLSPLQFSTVNSSHLFH